MMNDAEGMEGFIDRLTAKQQIENLREISHQMVADFKSIGLDMEEAIAYLPVPFHDTPYMVPLAALLLRKSWVLQERLKSGA